MRYRQGTWWAGVVAWMVIFALASGAAAEGDTVYPKDESIGYVVEYGPASLADLSLDIDCRSETEVSARLWAESQGMAQRVHPFRVRLDTVATVGSSGSLRAQTWIEEKDRVRRYRSRFDQTPRVTTRADIFGRESEETASLPDRGHDLLSWMLDLRDVVADEGRQTDQRRYPLWDGWKLVRLEVTPGTVDVRETAEGELRVQSFELERTELHHEGDELFTPKDDPETLGTIWVEVGERALPVAMSFEAPIGRVHIELTDYEVTECRQ